MTAPNRFYWLAVHLAAIAGGIYGAVRLFDWAG
jgi:hypothetical protein